MRGVLAVCTLAAVMLLAQPMAARKIHTLRQQTLAAAAAAGASDVEAAAEAEARFDVWGGLVKDQLHEAITSSALALAVKADRTAATYLLGDNLMKGVRWNDMPTGNKNDFLALPLFLLDFKTVSATIVHNSHYGCLQHMHAMAPVFTTRPAQPKPVQFTNADVYNIIANHAKYWWGKATTAGFAKDPATASHYLGHMSHMLQDSYAPGHAVRGYLQSYANIQNFRAETVPAHTATDADSAGMASQCGHVIHFQGYGSQEGSDGHGDTDHDPTSLKSRGRADNNVRSRLIVCARSATRDLYTAYVACMKSGYAAHAQCDFDATVKPAVFAPHFQLSLPNELAGGTITAMAGKAVVASVASHPRDGPWISVPTTFTDVIGTSQTGAANAIIIPRFDARTELMWSTVPHGVGLCDTFTARTGMLAMTTQRFLDFPNPDSTYADQDAAARTSRGAVAGGYQI